MKEYLYLLLFIFLLSCASPTPDQSDRPDHDENLTNKPLHSNDDRDEKNKFHIIDMGGAGHCFFYTIGPILGSIVKGQRPSDYLANNIQGQAKIRALLASQIKDTTVVNGVPIAQTLAVLKVAEPAEYGAVKSIQDLRDKLTNSGKFTGQTYWADDFAYSIAERLGDVKLILVTNNDFSNFSCYAGPKRRYVAFIRYTPGVHYQVIAYGNKNSLNYYFDYNDRKNWPAPVAELVNRYEKKCPGKP